MRSIGGFDHRVCPHNGKFEWAGCQIPTIAPGREGHYIDRCIKTKRKVGRLTLETKKGLFGRHWQAAGDIRAAYTCTYRVNCVCGTSVLELRMNQRRLSL